MGPYIYILIWEDGSIDITEQDSVDEWQASIEAGILEVIRVTTWPDSLTENGFEPVPR